MRWKIEGEETGLTGVVATSISVVLTVLLAGVLVGYALGLPLGRATCLVVAAWLVRFGAPRFWSS